MSTKHLKFRTLLGHPTPKPSKTRRTPTKRSERRSAAAAAASEPRRRRRHSSMLLSSARLALRGVRTVLGRKYDLRMNAGVNQLLRSLGNQASIRTITSSVHSPCPWRTLGLEQGASRGQIKRRYFELAKQTHPDTQAEDEAISFLAVFAAYEKLVALEASTRTPAGDGRSWQPSGQPSSTGTCQGASRKFQQPRRGRVVHREKTRGEFLCHQLEKDPHAAPQLWETICSWQQPMEVTSAMLEELFKASTTTIR